MSVCPSVRPSARYNSAATGRIFVKFDIWVFSKIVDKIQVSLKSDKNNGYFTLTYVHLWYLAQFL
jgi:hypothetical protein